MNKIEVTFAKAYINCKCDKNDDEYKIIVSALEKQIPKKATEETINRGIDISGEYDIDLKTKLNICLEADKTLYTKFIRNENQKPYAYKQNHRKSGQ